MGDTKKKLIEKIGSDDCFDVEVPGGMDVSKCPADAYQPKD